MGLGTASLYKWSVPCHNHLLMLTCCTATDETQPLSVSALCPYQGTFNIDGWHILWRLMKPTWEAYINLREYSDSSEVNGKALPGKK